MLTILLHRNSRAPQHQAFPRSSGVVRPCVTATSSKHKINKQQPVMHNNINSQYLPLAAPVTLLRNSEPPRSMLQPVFLILFPLSSDQLVITRYRHLGYSRKGSRPDLIPVCHNWIPPYSYQQPIFLALLGLHPKRESWGDTGMLETKVCQHPAC